MKYSLRTKLSISYILLAILIVLLISVLSNLFLEKYFTDYVSRNQKQKNKEVVTSISQQYKVSGEWNDDMIETIGVSALENGLIIKIKDKSGNMIWDATVHNNGMCQRIIQQMAENMHSRYPYMEGNYREEPYPIYYNLSRIGTVEIGSYGPFYLTDNDLAFINTLNKLLVGVGVLSLIIALVLGAIMAKRLSSPISRVINTARLISKGYFSDRVHEKSNTNEICLLNTTINDLAETLEGQEELRKRLTADVAHELRTPLATLQSHMEAMIDGIWKADTERLKSCHEEIVRLNKMVGDIEKLAKFESDNLVLSKDNVNISELVKRIIHNFEPDFKNREIALTFQGKNVKVLADRDKVSQVIINLISNALKYTQKGGDVKVSVNENDKLAWISVKDNGAGIPEADLPHIFERFYRADKSRNRLTGGSGIGLTIAKAIVKAHNGNIEVKSKVNEGTEFIISLPK